MTLPEVIILGIFIFAIVTTCKAAIGFGGDKWE